MNFKNRQQLLVIAAMGVVGLLLANVIVFNPLYKLWNDRSTQIDKLRNLVKANTELVKQEKQIEGRWASLKGRTLTNDQTLAEQKLHLAIDAWSRKSGVRLISVVSPPWKKDKSNDYMTLDCRIEASGNIRNLRDFLMQVENEPMALREQSVELSSKDNNGQQLVVGLQVSALMLTPAAPAPKKQNL